MPATNALTRRQQIDKQTMSARSNVIHLISSVQAWEAVCGQARFGARMVAIDDGGKVVHELEPCLSAEVVEREQWPTLPHQAQCKRCRRRGGWAALCATQEQVTAVEVALHAIARVFAP